MTSNYMLYIDLIPSNFYQSLEEATQAAELHIKKGCALMIENLAAPAPTRIWRYEYEEKDWVESL